MEDNNTSNRYTKIEGKDNKQALKKGYIILISKVK
jgi:hypothetical protein